MNLHIAILHCSVSQQFSGQNLLLSPGHPINCNNNIRRRRNISRNARSKGIDNCCGLYIRVYFRITPIENERRFINLIAI